MTVSKKMVKIECPYPNCDKAITAEVKSNWDKMSEKEQEELRQQVRNRLLPGLRKHHKDGHPK